MGHAAVRTISKQVCLYEHLFVSAHNVQLFLPVDVVFLRMCSMYSRAQASTRDTPVSIVCEAQSTAQARCVCDTRHVRRCVKMLVGHIHNFEKQLLKCCWSADGKQVAAGSADRMVNIWEVGCNNCV